MDNQKIIEDLIIEMSDRPPLPGEVLRFDALEAHAFFTIFNALNQDGLISKENLTFKSYMETFRVVNNQYKLSSKMMELPNDVLVTPLPEDIGFFTSLIPFFRIYVKTDYAKTKKIKELKKQYNLMAGISCSCENENCHHNPSEELPCSHTLKQHLTLLEGWYEREIRQAEEAAASRLAVSMVPESERHSGKQIIAKSDMEKMIKRKVKYVLENGLYSEEGTEQQIENFLYANPSWTREQAENAALQTKKRLEEDSINDLWKLAEDKFRIIDTSKKQ